MTMDEIRTAAEPLIRELVDFERVLNTAMLEAWTKEYKEELRSIRHRIRGLRDELREGI